MKKTVGLALLVLAVIALAVGCGKGKEHENAESVKTFSTIGEVLQYDKKESTEHAICGNYFVYAYDEKGVVYRAIAETDDDLTAKLFDLDYSDPDYYKKLEALVSPLRILRFENLNEGIPSQEELNQYVGKTGQELADLGFDCVNYYYEAMKYEFRKGLYNYEVEMEGTPVDSEDYSNESIAHLTVKSIRYDHVGDATYLELDDDGKLIQ